ncbi:MAG: polyprenol monophosphomannose synthase, partial [Deltaproteobacteria bacterium]
MPPSPRHRNVVLIPTYNEKENLPRIVPAVLQAAAVDIMVLDDKSPDGTGAIADRLAAADPRVQVVHRPAKQGLGAAYLDGFRRALSLGYERIIEMDADFSHPPDQLSTMLHLAERHDVVLGSRWVQGGGTRNWPLLRQLISRGGSLYARTVLGVGVKDLTGGYKCFRREVLERIELNAIRSTGYAFQIEMTYRAIQQGFDVVEMPIVFVEREQGVSKMSRRIVLEAILEVPRLRFERPSWFAPRTSSESSALRVRSTLSNYRWRRGPSTSSRVRADEFCSRNRRRHALD